MNSINEIYSKIKLTLYISYKSNFEKVIFNFYKLIHVIQVATTYVTK